MEITLEQHPYARNDCDRLTKQIDYSEIVRWTSDGSNELIRICLIQIFKLLILFNIFYTVNKVDKQKIRWATVERVFWRGTQ